jgi:hypothetical protein
MTQFGLVFTLWYISIFYFGLGVSTFLAWDSIWRNMVVSQKVEDKSRFRLVQKFKFNTTRDVREKFFLLPTIAFLWAVASHWGGSAPPVLWRPFPPPLEDFLPPVKFLFLPLSTKKINYRREFGLNSRPHIDDLCFQVKETTCNWMRLKTVGLLC